MGGQVGRDPLLESIGDLAISDHVCEKQLKKQPIYSSSELSTWRFASAVESFRDLKTKKAESSASARLKNKLLVAFHEVKLRQH